MADLRTIAVVSRLPKCDFCEMKGVDRPARYDFRTLARVWANGCEQHWEIHRADPVLGLGKGQLLLTPEEMEVRIG